jgi:hypothetical protein
MSAHHGIAQLVRLSGPLTQAIRAALYGFNASLWPFWARVTR